MFSRITDSVMAIVVLLMTYTYFQVYFWILEPLTQPFIYLHNDKMNFFLVLIQQRIYKMCFKIAY